MTEAFYIGAYWGPRGESVEQCAARLSDQLSSLSKVDPLLASWFETGRSRKTALARRVDPSAEKLRGLLLAGRQRRDDAGRSVMTELGYSASLWNGQDTQVGLTVRCGSAVGVPGMTSNSLSLQMPATEGDALALYVRAVALGVVRSVVTSWQPSWCTWTSHGLRKIQGAQPGEVVVGWTTYLADPMAVHVDRLPPEVKTEPLGGGLLLTLDGGADSASETTVLAVRDALRLAH